MGVSITLKERRGERTYSGDFVAAVAVSTDEDGGVSARLVHAPAVVETGMGFFVGAVELLQAVAAGNFDGHHVEAAKKALEAIDDMDPAKLCPFCNRKPRKDSDKAVWTQDHVLVACERCVVKMSRQEVAAALLARSYVAR